MQGFIQQRSAFSSQPDGYDFIDPMESSIPPPPPIPPPATCPGAVGAQGVDDIDEAYDWIDPAMDVPPGQEPAYKEPQNDYELD